MSNDTKRIRSANTAASPASPASTARSPAAGRSSDLYRFLIQSLRGYAIFTLDPTGVVVTWNDAAHRLAGYAADQIVGRHSSIFFPAEDAESGKPARNLEIAARTGVLEEEGWRVRKDGSRFWASVVITAMRDSDGVLVGFAVVTHDLTERRAIEQRAREEQALRRLAQSIAAAADASNIMHQIVDGAVAVSEAGSAYVEQVLESGERVEIVASVGYDAPPAGQQIAYPGSLTDEIIRRAEPAFLTRMEGIGASIAPYLNEHCSGCSVLVVPLLAHERVLGALVLIRRRGEPAFEPSVVARVRTMGDLASIALQRLLVLDESERRRLEAEAVARSREDVLSVVSHDLRNPLGTITMSASLLQDAEVALPEDQRARQLAIITRAAERMNRLIQDLLDAAKIEGGRLTMTCRCEKPSLLVAEVSDAFRGAAAEKKIAFTCEVEEGLPTLDVDRDRVLQALSNLLGNALKFTAAGGRIGLRVRRADEQKVEFAITDTGSGINPEDLPRLFDRFWQARGTARLGSGLGLAITKGIVEAHGGHISAESTPGQGSTFVIELPVSPRCS